MNYKWYVTRINANNFKAGYQKPLGLLLDRIYQVFANEDKGLHIRTIGMVTIIAPTERQCEATPTSRCYSIITNNKTPDTMDTRQT